MICLFLDTITDLEETSGLNYYGILKKKRLIMNKLLKPYDHIISKTPYRISLGGGGTDLPFYSNLKGL